MRCGALHSTRKETVFHLAKIDARLASDKSRCYDFYLTEMNDSDRAKRDDSDLEVIHKDQRAKRIAKRRAYRNIDGRTLDSLFYLLSWESTLSPGIATDLVDNTHEGIMLIG